MVPKLIKFVIILNVIFAATTAFACGCLRGSVVIKRLLLILFNKFWNDMAGAVLT